jgi:hypothetical protein
VFPVKYEMGFYIPQHGILEIHGNVVDTRPL